MSAQAKRPAGDGARVTVLVEVSPADAFDVFTREVDLWWRKGPRYRIAGRRRGQLTFEEGVGGRLFETFDIDDDDPTKTRTVDVGRITAWEPGKLLAFEWRGVNFKPCEVTFVEVRFDPSPSGTRVTLEHRGFAALPDDHPVRHGNVGADFSRMIGGFWGDLLTSFRGHADSRTPSL